MQHICSTTNCVRVVATLPPDPLKKKSAAIKNQSTKDMCLLAKQQNRRLHLYNNVRLISAERES